MTTDLTKPVQTADGRKVRIVCTDLAGEYPVLALVTTREGGAETVLSYDLQGGHMFHPELKLINIDTTPKNLRIAREAVAHILEALGYAETAQNYRDGKHDNCTEIRAALKAQQVAK